VVKDYRRLSSRSVSVFIKWPPIICCLRGNQPTAAKNCEQHAT